jgi:hypothetical protein
VYEYAWSSKHQHILKVGLFVLKSANPYLCPFSSHLLFHTTLSHTTRYSVYTRRCSVCTNTHRHQSTITHYQSRSVCSRVGQSLTRSVCIPSPSVTRDDAGVYEYTWSSKHHHTFSKSVCLLLSRLILDSVRSHHISCLTSPLVTRYDAGVYEYASSSKHHHTFSKSVCLFLSRPILNSVRSHHTSCIPSPLVTREDAGVYEDA